jgi:formylglycine-generating enzyme required for sulfatase activity
MILFAASAVVIALVGDSTVNDEGGWGPGFARSFGPEVRVVNFALNGRSSKSFRDEGRWQPVLEAKPQWVLIQFGHNDNPGKGPDRETDPRTTYRANLIRYMEEAEAAGARPVLITSIVRRNFDADGKIVRDANLPYVEEVRKIAGERSVPLLDLYALTLEQAEKLGPAESLKLGPEGDRTHLSSRGQQEIGALAARELVRVVPALRPMLADETLHTVTALLDGRGFVQIPAGEFDMGSTSGNPDEQPVHRVRITRPFEMGKYEVTQAQWDAVMRNPHAQEPPVNPSHFKEPKRPVENVSWDMVQQFLQRLNKRDPKHDYRLPTEAEWEYAARAGQGSTQALDTVAWHEGNAKGQTQPVGGKQPNAWGLYDMLGNVREWVQDWYSPESYAGAESTNPDGPDSGSYKVHRGCAWLSPANQCRLTFRGFDFPNPGQYSVGFRLVRTVR